MKLRFEKRWVRLKLWPTLALNIMWGALDSNSHIYHPNKPEGQRFETRRGPRFHYSKLDVHSPSIGHRVWFYFPSGRCWNLDLYVDRRGLTS
jgi:hypothetical protein